MKKDQLLKSIADTAYNVGFGGRKHWATYDIVDKVPGLIGFLSTAFGIFALIYDKLSEKSLSAAFIVFGLIALYITFYEPNKSSYAASANKLTTLFNALRDLYRTVQSHPNDDVGVYVDQLHLIEKDYYDTCISKQILFSDWYAHYKFFWQYQIDWLDEQKQFKLFRDKLPLSFMFWMVVFLGGVGVYVARHWNS
ncbi:SLATT domain-containing protein [Acidovorax sp. GBBC 3334]|uniref:SLATT domain-containing protein n=1 Tax=Acidovorax sp. GBBC 3334 TaxID=2940496 RepID=UPI002303BB80|nr:SLATT domain-containing protein [Acidovorax sp. GBBC 3334]MDA8456983.1 SLATT domain-containing protein [Acidovorax sp. GBBC 3334]